MSVSYTYASLRQALIDWCEDDFEDFTDQLDDIIAKAETRCLRDLDLEIFDTTDTSKSTAASNATLALADGAILLRSLFVNERFVEPRSESYIRYYNELSGSGQPLYWCQTGGTTITLAPIPDGTYMTRQRVMKRPAGLSDSNASTFLSKHAGDLLFTACLLHSEWFDKAPEDMAKAEQKYLELLAMAKVELRHVMRRDYA